MRRLARGRVWTGKDALAHGLVDALGGLADAIALAKAEAGLPLQVPAGPDALRFLPALPSRHKIHPSPQGFYAAQQCLMRCAPASLSFQQMSHRIFMSSVWAAAADVVPGWLLACKVQPLPCVLSLDDIPCHSRRMLWSSRRWASRHRRWCSW